MGMCAAIMACSRIDSETQGRISNLVSQRYVRDEAVPQRKGCTMCLASGCRSAVQRFTLIGRRVLHSMSRIAQGADIMKKKKKSNSKEKSL